MIYKRETHLGNVKEVEIFEGSPAQIEEAVRMVDVNRYLIDRGVLPLRLLTEDTDITP